MNVKGLSIQDIMNIDLDTFNKLKESELRALNSRLVSASNKRVRRLQQQDIISPALQSLRGNVKFSTKIPQGLNVKQRVNYLRQQYARMRTFLTSKTSTLSGAKEVTKRIKQTISDKYGVELTGKQLNNIHKIMEKLRKKGKIGGRGSQTSDMMFQKLSNRIVESGGRLKYGTKKYMEKYEKIADNLYLKSQGADVGTDVLEDEEDETESFGIDS